MTGARQRIASEPWSVGIIGAGIVGLATARALEEQDVQCELFEPEAPGGGQSRGPVQIITGGGTDPQMVRLKRDSLAIMLRWEREAGVELFSRRGVVMFGRENGDRAEAFSAAPVEDDSGPLSPEELAGLLPAAPRSVPASFDRHGGVAWSQRIIGCLLRGLAAPVIPLRADRVEILPDGRTAVTAGLIRREYDAVVVAAGASTRGLAAPLGVTIPVRESTRIYSKFGLQPPFAGVGMAPFTGRDRDGAHAFGAPLRDNRGYRVVLDRPIESDPEDGSVSPELLESVGHELERWVNTTLPGLMPQGADLGSVRVTRLPWADAFGAGIGIWRRGPVLFPAGSPMFSTGAAIGGILAEAGQGRPVPPGIRPGARLGSLPARQARKRAVDRRREGHGAGTSG